MFQEMLKALRDHKFVALIETEDGGIEFVGSYDRKEICFYEFTEKHPEIMSKFPDKIVLVETHYLVRRYKE